MAGGWSGVRRGWEGDLQPVTFPRYRGFNWGRVLTGCCPKIGREECDVDLSGKRSSTIAVGAIGSGNSISGFSVPMSYGQVQRGDLFAF